MVTLLMLSLIVLAYLVASIAADLGNAINDWLENHFPDIEE